jgi:hypothetical protein
MLRKTFGSLLCLIVLTLSLSSPAQKKYETGSSRLPVYAGDPAVVPQQKPTVEGVLLDMIATYGGELDALSRRISEIERQVQLLRGKRQARPSARQQSARRNAVQSKRQVM